MRDPASPANGPVDYEYTQSRGAHGHHAVGLFDAFVGSQREIWIGSDGSGLIREASGPGSAFTEEGRARQLLAVRSSPVARVSISSNQGACPAPALGVPGVALHPDGLEAELASRGPLTLHAVQELLGEAVVEPEFCRAVYEIARGLPGAEVIDSICDQLGRAGDGLARIEHAHRIELIFSPDISQLLAYQQFLAEPQPFAPGETLHSWSAFVGRRIVAGLPPRFPRCPGFLAFRPALALAL